MAVKTLEEALKGITEVNNRKCNKKLGETDGESKMLMTTDNICNRVYIISR